jgi:predicted nucleic acid-binding protein
VISLDTNVFVYAVNPDAGLKHETAKRLVSEAARDRAVVALQVLGEFLAVMRRRAIAFDDAVRYVDWARETFRIVTADLRSLEAAVGAIVQHQIPVWDAMLWATLDQAGCRTLLTEDFQDGRTLGGVRFLNPFNPANDETIARLTRPLRAPLRPTRRSSAS